MPRLSHRLALLRRFGRSAREAALLAAVPWARPEEEADEIALELADAAGMSARPLGVFRGALSMWTRLSPTARSGLLSAVGDDLAPVLEELAGSGVAPDRVAAAALSADLLNGARLLAPHEHAAAVEALMGLATDGSGEVASTARRGVVACCRSTLDAGGDSTVPRALSAWLESALVKVLSMWSEHRDAECVSVALEAADGCGPALRAWFGERDEPAHMALRGLAKRAVLGEVGAGRIVGWLALPALAPVALGRIEGADEGVQSALLRGAHLLAFRGRASVLRRARAAERLISSDQRLAEDPPALRRASIRLARLVASPDRRLLHLSGFLADPDALTRLHAVQALADEPAGRLVDETLGDFSLDASPDVSAASACVLAGAQSPARRRSLAGVFRTLTRSPHAPTRALAWLVHREFEPFCVGADADRRWEHGAAAARALRSDRQGFLRSVSAALHPDAPSRERVATLHVVERLRLGAELMDELLRLVHDRDQRVVAKAVRVLAGASDLRVTEALAALLSHDDPRVRAEAVAGVGRREPQRVRAFLHDPTARVRSNAAVALARGGDPGAERAVMSMLEDPRPAHRLSGLWSAEVLGLTGLLSKASDLLTGDPDPPVRARASRCTRRLIAKARLEVERPADAAPTLTQEAVAA